MPESKNFWKNTSDNMKAETADIENTNKRKAGIAQIGTADKRKTGIAQIGTADKRKADTEKKCSGKAAAKGKWSLLLVLLMAVMVAVAFSGCDDAKDQGKKDEDKTEYTEVAHLNFPISNIRTLNPSVSKDEDTYFISRLIYDGLFKIDENMTPVLNLASNYKFKKSNASCTISLVDTKFHDGKKLKAKDVKFTIEAFKAAGASCRYKPLVDKISHAETLSGNRIKIYFNSKNSMSIGMLTFPILPAHKYDSVYSLNQKKDSFKPVGTGQYRYKSFKDKISLELKANADYHGDKAENSLSFIVTKKSSSAYQLVEASSLSALVTRSADREARVGQKEQKIISFPGNEIEFIGFNFNQDKTYSRNVRKAVAYAMDNSTMIEEVFVNSGIPNDSLYGSGYLGSEQYGDSYPHSRSKALSFFEVAGYKDRNGDGMIESDQGVTLNFNILVNSDSKERNSLAKIVKRNLKSVGVGSTITAVPGKTYNNYLKNGNFDIFVGGLRFDEVMDLRFMLQGEKKLENPQQRNNYSNYNNSNGYYGNQQGQVKDEDEDLDEDEDTEAKNKRKEQQQKEEKKLLSRKMDNSNYARYYNPKLNKALSKMMTGASIDSMKTQLDKAKKILIKDLPYYCLLQRTYGVVYSPSLKGTMTPIYDNYYNGIGGMVCRYEVAPKDDEENAEEGSEQQ